MTILQSLNEPSFVPKKKPPKTPQVPLNDLFGEKVSTGAVTQKKVIDENFYPAT